MAGLALLVALLHWLGLALLAAALDPRQDPDVRAGWRWFSIPITVDQLPPSVRADPVSIAINLSAALERLGVSGAVDEHSLRLFAASGGLGETEQPVQFAPRSQPRAAQRQLLPGTSPRVSYLAEFPSGVTPAGIAVEGDLTWLASADANGRGRYRLDFGILTNGRAVQTPFPPQDLRMFDSANRATPSRWFPRMQIRPQWPLEGKLSIFDQGQLLTSYYPGPGQSSVESAFRRPFLYPLIGPDGVCLTEYGKPHDPTGSHAHHCSLWIAHADVGGRDFWSEKGGAIVHEQFEVLEDGPLFCRTVQRTRWMAGAEAILRERREFTFYTAQSDYRLIDLDLQFRAAGAQTVTFGTTSFGFLAARVAQSMTVFDGGGEILNANGDRNEQGAHLRRASWIDQSGPIAQDKWNGLAIFDHPGNPNYPTAWHCRNDGWAGAAFNLDNPYPLEPGQTLHLRYRLCLHRHDARRGEVAARYTEYAAQPIVRLGDPVEKQP